MKCLQQIKLILNYNIMEKEKTDYYNSQLSKINFHCLYCPMVKFSDENGSTNYLQVNKESAVVIIKKLKKEFNL